ncbi:YmfQ family protein [Pectobacterium actinidiae]|uniref:YmfQ family protein n=1 Tax=Pectobacterium actinidiae TaxID=1507808 RepID=A0ABW8G7G4_9GAMM
MNTRHQTLLGLLLPAPYDANGDILTAELSAEGAALDNSSTLATNALSGVTPFYAQNLLADWERVLAITPDEGSGYQQRLDNVLIKIAETGGLSISYFTRLASRLGYSITIDELQAFRAGVSRAGDHVLKDDFKWAWRVNVNGSRVKKYYFTAGLSVAGDRLMTFGDSVIESMLNDLKPAHTFIYFAYQEN